MTLIGSKINRDLPNDEYEAAINANSPTSGNPFATIADLNPDTIYTADGSLLSDREVGLGTFDLNFALSNANGRFSVGPVGMVANRPIHFKAWDTNPVRVEGFNTSDGARAFEVVNGGGGLDLFYVENNGDVILSPEIGQTTRSRVTIGTTVVQSLARLTVRGTNTAVTPTAIFQDSLGQMILQMSNDGRVGVHTMGLTAERFNIRGIGDSSATKSFVLEDINGVPYFTAYDSGQVVVGDVTILDASFALATTSILVENPSGNSEIEIRATTGAAYLQINNNVSSNDSYIHFANAGINKISVGWDDSAQRFRMGETSIDAGVFYEYDPAANEGRHISPLSIGAAYPVNSIFEVAGDVETVGSTNGLVVEDRTNANRYRIYTDGGVLNTELA